MKWKAPAAWTGSIFCIVLLLSWQLAVLQEVDIKNGRTRLSYHVWPVVLKRTVLDRPLYEVAKEWGVPIRNPVWARVSDASYFTKLNPFGYISDYRGGDLRGQIADFAATMSMSEEADDVKRQKTIDFLDKLSAGHSPQ